MSTQENQAQPTQQYQIHPLLIGDDFQTYLLVSSPPPTFDEPQPISEDEETILALMFAESDITLDQMNEIIDHGYVFYTNQDNHVTICSLFVDMEDGIRHSVGASCRAPYDPNLKLVGEALSFKRAVLSFYEA